MSILATEPAQLLPMYYAEGYGASCFQGMACGGSLVQAEFRWVIFSHIARSQ